MKEDIYDLEKNRCGIYIHIPFCLRKCSYCDFISYAGREELFEEYVNAVVSEISLTAKKYSNLKIYSIYFGGGTPTLLLPSQIDKILSGIYKNFNVISSAEITIEANPETLSLSKLKSLFGIGFNRISIGVQSLDDNILKTLGRSHTSYDAIESYYFARQAGFDNINFDLIFGVPGQNINGWTETLDKVVNLAPEHISAYCLTLNNKNKYLQEVGEDLQADLFTVTRNQLSLNGYNHYEISNFSRMNFECRHNLLYWENQNYIGLGIAAHSHINNKRFHNCSSVNKYINRIADGKIYSMDLEDLTENEARKETIFLGLRLIKGINNNQFTSRFKYSVFELYPKEISSLQEKELIVFLDGNLKLTEKGLMLANYAFMEFV